MRKLIYAVPVAFALATVAPFASAGENCAYGGHATKKNDLETPPPATAASTEKKTSS